MKKKMTKLLSLVLALSMLLSMLPAAAWAEEAEEEPELSEVTEIVEPEETEIPEEPEEPETPEEPEETEIPEEPEETEIPEEPEETETPEEPEENEGTTLPMEDEEDLVVVPMAGKQNIINVGATSLSYDLASQSLTGTLVVNDFTADEQSVALAGKTYNLVLIADITAKNGTTNDTAMIQTGGNYSRLAGGPSLTNNLSVSAYQLVSGTVQDDGVIDVDMELSVEAVQNAIKSKSTMFDEELQEATSFAYTLFFAETSEWNYDRISVTIGSAGTPVLATKSETALGADSEFDYTEADRDLHSEGTYLSLGEFYVWNTGDAPAANVTITLPAKLVEAGVVLLAYGEDAELEPWDVLIASGAGKDAFEVADGTIDVGIGLPLASVDTFKETLNNESYTGMIVVRSSTAGVEPLEIPIAIMFDVAGELAVTPSTITKTIKYDNLSDTQYWTVTLIAPYYDLNRTAQVITGTPSITSSDGIAGAFSITASSGWNGLWVTTGTTANIVATGLDNVIEGVGNYTVTITIPSKLNGHDDITSDAVLTINLKVEQDAVPVSVNVSVDGDPFGDLEVALYTQGETPAKVADLTEDTASEAATYHPYTGTVMPGTYDVYVGGANTGVVLNMDTSNTAEAAYYTITASAGASAHGSVSVSGQAGKTATSGGNTVYLSGSTVTLTATPDANWMIDTWSVGSGSPELSSTTAAAPTLTATATGSYTASWKSSVVTYTVTYHENSGSWVGGAPTQAAVAADAEFTTAAGTTVSRSGYTFAGWSTTAAGTGAHAVTKGGGVKTTINELCDVAGGGTAGNVNLYAQWTPVPPTFAAQNATITYGTTTAAVLNLTASAATAGATAQFAVAGGSTIPTWLEMDTDGKITLKTAGTTGTVPDSPYKFNVTVTDSSNHATTTAEVTITVTKAKWPAVTLTRIADVTTAGGTEGSFSVNDYNNSYTYEYKTDGGASYTTGLPGTNTDGTLTGIAEGTYYVRIKGDDNHEPGEPGDVTIAGPSSGFVAITLTQDGVGNAYTGQTVKLDSADASGTAVPETGSTGVYNASSIGAGSHDVYVNGSKVGSVTVSNGNTATATYAYFTYSLTVGSNGSRGGSATANGVYISGTALDTTVSAAMGYEVDGWKNNDSAIASSAVPTSLTAKTELEVTFKKSAVSVDDMEATGAVYGTDIPLGSAIGVPGGAKTAGWADDTFYYALKSSESASGLTLKIVAEDAEHAVKNGVKAFEISGKPQIAAEITWEVTATSVSNGETADGYVKITPDKATATLTVTVISRAHAVGADPRDEVTYKLEAPYFNPTLYAGSGDWEDSDVRVAAGSTKGALATFGTLTTDDADDQINVGEKDYKFSLALNEPYGDVWNSPVTATKKITGIASYTVTLTKNLDGTNKYTGDTGAIYLVGSGDDAYNANGNMTDGIITFNNVPSGQKYELHADSADGKKLAEIAELKDNWSPVVPYFTVTVKAGEHGSVSGSDSTTATVHINGTSLNLKATANNGYQFKDWAVTSGTVTGIDSTSSANTTFTVPTTGSGPVVITASFEEKAFTFNGDEWEMDYNGTLSKTVSASADYGDATVSFTYAGGTGFPAWLKITGDTVSLQTANTTGNAGTYTFRINATADTNSRTQYAEFTLKVKPIPLPDPVLDPTAATTYGGSEGTIKITNISDYPAGTTFSISPAGGTWDGTNSKFTGLEKGSYTVTATNPSANYTDSSKGTTVDDGKLYAASVTIKVDPVDGTIDSYTSGADNEIVSAVLSPNSGGSGDVTLTREGTTAVWKTTGTPLSTDVADGYTLKVTTNHYTYTTSAVVDKDHQNDQSADFFRVKFDETAALSNFATWSAKITVAPEVAAASATGAAANGAVVMTGTNVTFTTAAWTEDYALTWDNSLKNTGDAANNNVVLAVSAKITDPVTATLTQNTHTISGTTELTHGKGNVGHVKSVTFTTDGNDVTATYNSTDGNFSANLPAGFAYTFAGAIKAANTDDTVIDHYEVGADNHSNEVIVKVDDDENPDVKMVLDGAVYAFSVKDDNGGDATETWSNKTYGYGTQPDAVTVTVKNEGNRPMTFQVAASGSSSSYETVSGDLTAQIGAGESHTFNVQPKTGLDAGTHAATYTIHAFKADGTTKAADDQDYTASFAVDKAVIVSAAVTLIDAPEYDVDLDVEATAAAEDENDDTNGDVLDGTAMPDLTKATVSWTDGDTKAKEAKKYTATVTLTADKNHTFDTDTYRTAYTILGVNTTTGTGHGVTCTAAGDGSTLTLTYTFDHTATAITVGSAEGIDYDAGKFSASAVGAGLHYYYVAVPGDKTGDVPTAEDVFTAFGASDDEGKLEGQLARGDKKTDPFTGEEITDLPNANAEYTVFVITRVEPEGGTPGAWSGVKALKFKTWYKVTIAVDTHWDTQTTAKNMITFTPDNLPKSGAKTLNTSSETDAWGSYIGVKQGDKITMDVTQDGDTARGWEFQTWSDGVDSAKTTASNTYTPTDDKLEVTGTFRKVINGVVTLDKIAGIQAGNKLTAGDSHTNSNVRVIIGDDDARFGEEDQLNTVKFVWQYSVADDDSDWTQIMDDESNAHDKVSYTVKSSDAGRKFRVMAVYDNEEDGYSKTNFASTGKATTKLGKPQPTLVKAEHGESSNGATDAENDLGGLVLTFNSIEEDEAENNPVKEYEYIICRSLNGGAAESVATGKISATGANSYKLHLPADESNIVPTHDDNPNKAKATYTATLKAITNGGSYESSDVSAASAESKAGRVVFDMTQLTSQMPKSGTVSNKNAKFETAFATDDDGSAKVQTLTINTKNTAKSGAVTIYYDAGEETPSNTTGQANVDDYEVAVRTAGGYYYLPLETVKVADWKITPATINAVEVKAIPVPAADGDPTADAFKVANLPADVFYVDKANGGEGAPDAGKVNLTWTTVDGDPVTTFKPGVKYVATAEVKPDSNHVFASSVGTKATPATGTAQTGTATGVDAAGPVTVSYTFDAVPLPAPTVTAAAKDNTWDTATMTKLEVEAGAAVKFYYIIGLADANPSAATVKGGSTQNGDAGTVADGKSTWTGTADLTSLNPHTAYRVFAVAEVNGVTSPVGKSEEFYTNYKVVVESDGHGTVKVGDGTATKNKQEFAMAENDTVDLTATPDDATWEFDAWTGSTANMTDNTLKATGDAGTISVKATFHRLYTVVYDGNDKTSGSVPADETPAVAGAKVTLAAAGDLAKAGYTFQGWSLKKTGGTTLTAGSQYTVADGDADANGKITMYAVWAGSELTFGTMTITVNYNDITWGGTSVNTVSGGTGDGTENLVFNTTLGATGNVGDVFPDFLKIDAAGKITWSSTANAKNAHVLNTDPNNAAAAYKAVITVTDSESLKSKTAELHFIVTQQEPDTVDLDYTLLDSMSKLDSGVRKGFINESVVDSGTIGGTIKDKYDNTVILYADAGVNRPGTWTAADEYFAYGTDEKTGVIQNYTFSFGVTSNPNDYKTVTFTKELSSVYKTPSIGIWNGTKYVYTFTETETITYGADPTASKTVTVGNTGEAEVTGLTVTVDDTTPYPTAPTLALTSLDAKGGTNDSTTFTFAPKPSPQPDADTYTYTFTVKGIPAGGSEDDAVSATYIYKLVVNPVEIDAQLNITKPDATKKKTDVVPAKKNDGDHFAIGTHTWTGTFGGDDNNEFLPGQSYTISIPLTPDTNYAFKTAGGTYTLTDGDGDHTPSLPTLSASAVVMTYTWSIPSGELTVTAAGTDYDKGEITKLEAASAVELKYYYVVSTKGDEAATKDQVKAASVSGTDGFTGTILAHGSKNGGAVADGKSTWTGTINVTGLDPHTTYYVYAVSEPKDGGTLSAVKTEPFTTHYKVTVKVLEGGTATLTTAPEGTDFPAAGLTGADPAATKTFGVPDGTASIKLGATPAAHGTDSAPIASWAVFDWGADGTDGTTHKGEGDDYTYTFDANTDTAVVIQLDFHKKIAGKFDISGTVGKGETLTAATFANAADGELYIGDDKITNLASTGNLTYQWYAGNDEIGGATGQSFTIPNDGSENNYAGKTFKVVITYTGDPAYGGGHSSVEAVTEVLKLKLDAPELALEPRDDSNNGGLKLTITKSTDDVEAKDRVASYSVKLYDGETEVEGAAKSVPADNQATYEVTWDLDSPDLDPTKTYTVKVTAISKDADKYIDSNEVEASEKPAKKVLAVAADAFEFTDSTFNGRFQEAVASKKPTLPEGAAITYYYSNDADDTDGRKYVGTYDMYYSISEGTRYKAVAISDTQADWKILQATPAMKLAKASGQVRKDNPFNLAEQAGVSTAYTAGAGTGNPEYATDANGTVTTRYDYTYTLTSYTGSGTVTTGVAVGDATNFVPTEEGTYVFTISAAYNGTATADYKRDVGEPEAKTFTLTVNSRIVKGIEILPGNATVTAAYGTAAGTYMNGLGNAADAKLMELTGLIVRVYYEDETPDCWDYPVVVGDQSLPDGLVWHVSTDTTYATDSDKIALGTEDDNGTVGVPADDAMAMTFQAAAKGYVWVELSGLKSIDSAKNKSVAYEMSAKTVDYTVNQTGGTKVYDGTTNVDVTLAKDDADVLVGDTVTVTGDTSALKLDNKNVGTDKTITGTVTGLTLGGTDSGFYKLGSETRGKAAVTKATLKVTDILSAGYKDKARTTAVAKDAADKTDKSSFAEATAADGVITGNAGFSDDDTYGLKGNDTVRLTFKADYGDVSAARDPAPVTLVWDPANIQIDESTGDGKNYTLVLGGAPASLTDGKITREIGTITEQIAENIVINVTKPATTNNPSTNGVKKATTTSTGVEIKPDVDDDHPTTTWKVKDGEDITGSTTNFPEGIYTMTTIVQPKPGWSIKNPPKVTVPGSETGSVQVTDNSNGTWTVSADFKVTKPAAGGGGGGGGGEVCPPIVRYYLGTKGVTMDATVEDVAAGKTPANVPAVKALNGYVFKGWSESDPAKLAAGKAPTLVDPTTVKVSKDMVFYAVYETAPVEFIDHKHYVIGYPDGTFGPGDAINRASVATIIARAILPDFVEGADYGNPGGYSDVEGHWALSAISYCTMYNVFTGYDDGSFGPDKPITRQEFALVMARLAGVQPNQGMPFTDAGDIGFWAVDGVYTAYANGWVIGYTDGTFKPLNDIRRDEAVKIFNAYLNRGVDAQGLEGLKEYVHTGVASNNTEDGTKEYMTWPDVPKTQWAYYEIIEAANDHQFHWPTEKETPPEDWDKVWIDEVWRYYDESGR